MLLRQIAFVAVFARTLDQYAVIMHDGGLGEHLPISAHHSP